jgi:hypothetical protein
VPFTKVKQLDTRWRGELIQVVSVLCIVVV